MSAADKDRESDGTNVFGAYSAYYDLLYRDKDYAGEAQYIRSLIARHQPAAQTVLDLGCGTGRHALLLAEAGYRMSGVDLSREMLTRARAHLAGASSEESARFAASGAAPEFIQGDVRSVRLGRTFDAVVSLFHVMSYQTTNADLTAAFRTAKAHLKPGGLFVFDCWYGPAVLTLRPSVRIARLQDERTAVTRLAEPVLHPNQNLVDVNYQVLIKDKQSGRVDELRETHTMRYLFAPEVAAFAETCGFAVEQSLAFMSDQVLGFDTWTAVFVARALA